MVKTIRNLFFILTLIPGLYNIASALDISTGTVMAAYNSASNTLSYTGKLSDKNVAVDESKDITFNICSSLSCSEILWTSVVNAEVKQGTFTAVINLSEEDSSRSGITGVEALALGNGSYAGKYLQAVIEDIKFTPAEIVSAFPYALSAKKLEKGKIYLREVKLDTASVTGAASINSVHSGTVTVTDALYIGSAGSISNLAGGNKITADTLKGDQLTESTRTSLGTDPIAPVYYKLTDDTTSLIAVFRDNKLGLLTDDPEKNLDVNGDVALDSAVYSRGGVFSFDNEYSTTHELTLNLVNEVRGSSFTAVNSSDEHNFTLSAGSGRLEIASSLAVKGVLAVKNILNEDGNIYVSDGITLSPGTRPAALIYCSTNTDSDCSRASVSGDKLQNASAMFYNGILYANEVTIDTPTVSNINLFDKASVGALVNKEQDNNFSRANTFDGLTVAGGGVMITGASAAMPEDIYLYAGNSALVSEAGGETSVYFKNGEGNNLEIISGPDSGSVKFAGQNLFSAWKNSVGTYASVGTPVEAAREATALKNISISGSLNVPGSTNTISTDKFILNGAEFSAKNEGTGQYYDAVETYDGSSSTTSVRLDAASVLFKVANNSVSEWGTDGVAFSAPVTVGAKDILFNEDYNYIAGSSGYTDISGLTADKSASVSGALTVQSQSVFSDTVSVNGDMELTSVSGALKISGETDVAGGLTASKDVLLAGKTGTYGRVGELSGVNGNAVNGTEYKFIVSTGGYADGGIYIYGDMYSGNAITTHEKLYQKDTPITAGFISASNVTVNLTEGNSFTAEKSSAQVFTAGYGGDTVIGTPETTSSLSVAGNVFLSTGTSAAVEIGLSGNSSGILDIFGNADFNGDSDILYGVSAGSVTATGDLNAGADLIVSGDNGRPSVISGNAVIKDTGKLNADNVEARKNTKINSVIINGSTADDRLLIRNNNDGKYGVVSYKDSAESGNMVFSLNGAGDTTLGYSGGDNTHVIYGETDIHGDVNVADASEADRYTLTAGTVTAKGDVNAEGVLTVSGSSRLKGDTEIGDDSGDAHTVNGTVTLNGDMNTGSGTDYTVTAGTVSARGDLNAGNGLRVKNAAVIESGDLNVETGGISAGGDITSGGVIKGAGVEIDGSGSGEKIIVRNGGTEVLSVGSDGSSVIRSSAAVNGSVYLSTGAVEDSGIRTYIGRSGNEGGSEVLVVYGSAAVNGSLTMVDPGEADRYVLTAGTVTAKGDLNAEGDLSVGKDSRFVGGFVIENNGIIDSDSITAEKGTKASHITVSDDTDENAVTVTNKGSGDSVNIKDSVSSVYSVSDTGNITAGRAGSGNGHTVYGNGTIYGNLDLSKDYSSSATDDYIVSASSVSVNGSIKSGALFVGGNTAIAKKASFENLEINGDVNIEGNVVSGGSVEISSITSGNSVTASALTAGNGISVNSGDLKVSAGGIGVSGGIETPAGLTASSMTFTGTAGYNSLVFENAGVTVSSVGYDGSAYIAGKLSVAGAAALASSSGSSFTLGNISDGNSSLSVYGRTVMNGALHMNENGSDFLLSAGSVTASGDLTSFGGLTVGGSYSLNALNIFKADGNSAFAVDKDGYTGVGSSAVSGKELSITGAGIISGALSSGGGLAVSGLYGSYGNIITTGTFTVNKDSSAAEAVTVAGLLKAENFSGSLNMADSNLKLSGGLEINNNISVGTGSGSEFSAGSDGNIGAGGISASSDINALSGIKTGLYGFDDTSALTVLSAAAGNINSINSGGAVSGGPLSALSEVTVSGSAGNLLSVQDGSYDEKASVSSSGEIKGSAFTAGSFSASAEGDVSAGRLSAESLTVKDGGGNTASFGASGAVSGNSLSVNVSGTEKANITSSGIIKAAKITVGGTIVLDGSSEIDGVSDLKVSTVSLDNSDVPSYYMNSSSLVMNGADVTVSSITAGTLALGSGEYYLSSSAMNLNGAEISGLSSFSLSPYGKVDFSDGGAYQTVITSGSLTLVGDGTELSGAGTVGMISGGEIKIGTSAVLSSGALSMDAEGSSEISGVGTVTLSGSLDIGDASLTSSSLKLSSGAVESVITGVSQITADTVYLDETDSGVKLTKSVLKMNNGNISGLDKIYVSSMVAFGSETNHLTSENVKLNGSASFGDADISSSVKGTNISAGTELTVGSNTDMTSSGLSFSSSKGTISAAGGTVTASTVYMGDTSHYINSGGLNFDSGASVSGVSQLGTSADKVGTLTASGTVSGGTAALTALTSNSVSVSGAFIIPACGSNSDRLCYTSGNIVKEYDGSFRCCTCTTARVYINSSIYIEKTYSSEKNSDINHHSCCGDCP